MQNDMPIYSHNPYHATQFPLLVLHVKNHRCTPSNEGFRVFHWHDEVQFVYVLRGSIHVKIFQEEFDVQPHNAVFINRTALHQIIGKEDYQYHSYIIPVKMLSFFSGSIMEQRDVGSVVNHPALTHYLLRDDAPAHRSVLHQLQILDKLYFQEGTQEHAEYHVSIQLCKVWLELLSVLPERNEIAPAVNYERIRTLISAIHTNYNQPISVQDIADAAHISKTECLRCFQNYLHTTPYQYLMKYRLHMSTGFLTSTAMSVTDIALHVGFHSVSSYIKYFKLAYHMTPNQYRAQNQALE